nr:uncharacterized protein LOC129012684 isoform X3 [Pongo pygmaeus]
MLEWTFSLSVNRMDKLWNSHIRILHISKKQQTSATNNHIDESCRQNGKEKYWSSKTNRGRSCCCCMVSRNSDNFIIPYLHPRERKKNYNHFPLTHQPINLQIKAIKKQSKCEEGRKCDEEILWRKQLPLLPWDLPIVLTELALAG